MFSGIAEDDGSYVTVHFRNVYFERGSFIHASQVLRPEKRGSPLPMGRTGTDSITLTLHCVRTRPAGKEVRLRLDFLDARFILSGSVVHFVPDTSSEGKRRRETATASVPFLSTPSATDSQSGIAPLSLRSICAGHRRSRGFSSSVVAAGFTLTTPSPEWSRLRSQLQFRCLHSVTQAPSAGPAHTSEVRCRFTLIQPSVPEPERPSSLAPTIIPSGSCRACRLACSLVGSRKERC